MRLIDADKIYWEYKCISKEEIDDEPTVKAIPIDWIKEWVFKTEIRDKIICYDLRDMVEDWEKENGIVR